MEIAAASLDGNGRLSEAAMQALNRLAVIRTFQVGDFGEPLKNTCATQVGSIASVQSLVLRNASEVNDQDLSQFPGNSGLHGLTLVNPENVTTDGFAAFSQVPLLEQLPRLCHLSLIRTQVDDGLSESIAKLSTRTSVSQEECPVSDEFLVALATRPELTVIDMERIQVTDSGLEAFAAAAAGREISELRLSGTQITEAGLQHLLKLKNRNGLSVSRNLEISEATTSALKEKFRNLSIRRSL